MDAKIGFKLFEKLTGRFEAQKFQRVTVTGSNENIGNFLVSDIARAGEVFLVIAPNQDSAERSAYEIETMSRIADPGVETKVSLFSSLEWSPYEFLSPSLNLLSDRISALKSITDFKSGSKNKKLIIVAPLNGLSQKTC
ncbi:MAG TPA: hypothetical protein PKK26_08365, partial [Candidatus Wallbacteria bacterium]|nr:hypothetical protein [Candidatus Wallbacteria bacterium]